METKVTPYETPTVLVIFGASGDLTKRKLVPALSGLVGDGYVGEFYVVGASRTPYSDEEFREELHTAVKEFSQRAPSDEAWEKFAQNIYYQPLDGTKVSDFESLKERLGEITGWEEGQRVNYLYYLSTAARFFVPIAENLKSAGLVEQDPEAPRKTRLIVEKPFGDDLDSAKRLNSELRECFREDQIFRIDHYLGKETVQNILVMRFCNNVFEPLWNNRYIEQIQISVCEDIGVGTRADFFDRTGITRDIVQNHVMQMLSLLCIEPPISLKNPDYIRDEKVKVLRAIRRYSHDEVSNLAVRGQYDSGLIRGEPVVSYRDEKGVSDDSQAETFVAMKLEINNWRWVGVPIYIRAGKRLPKRVTQISVFFREVPDSLIGNSTGLHISQNVLSIQVQPREGVRLSLNSKLPGLSMRVKPVELDFSYVHSFAERSPDAYERLLLDAIKGDSTLFTRDDEIEEAWDVLSPFFEVWGNQQGKVWRYPAGTWGPDRAALLLSHGKHSWQDLS